MTTPPVNVTAISRGASSWIRPITWLALAALAMLGQGGTALAGGADPTASGLLEHVAVASGDASRRLVQRQDTAGRDQDVEHDSGPDGAILTTTIGQAAGNAGRPIAPSATQITQPSSDGRYHLHAPRGPPAA